MLGHYASYDTNYFTLSNSLSYVASTIGSLHVPILVGVVGKTPCAVCTVGEWALCLQHHMKQQFRLDVVSFPKNVIEQIVSIDPDFSPESKLNRFHTFIDYFCRVIEFGDSDTNTIPFLEELYDEFPIRSLFDSLNAFCDHCFDGKDTDIARPEDIVISASARRFLESRVENNNVVESSLAHPANEEFILTSDTSIPNCNANVNESVSDFDKTKTGSTGNTTATVTRSKTARHIPRFRTFTMPKESDWMAFRPSFYQHDTKPSEAKRLASILPQVVMLSHYLQNTVVENSLHWSEAAKATLTEKHSSMETCPQRLVENECSGSCQVIISNDSALIKSSQQEILNVISNETVAFVFCRSSTKYGRDAPLTYNQLTTFKWQSLQKEQIGQKWYRIGHAIQKSSCKGQLQDAIIFLEALSEQMILSSLIVGIILGLFGQSHRYQSSAAIAVYFNHFSKGGWQVRVVYQGG